VNCSCCSTNEEAANRRLSLLESIDFKAVGEQALAVASVADLAVRSLTKVERAQELGLGHDVIALHRKAAERNNNQARRQIVAARAALEERTSRPDFPELTERLRVAFDERDGGTILDESRDQIVLTLFETDGLSAADAAYILKIYDETFASLREGGLRGVTQLLDQRLVSALAARDLPGMGREEASPLSQNQWICLAVVAAATAIALAVCLAAYGCWCCYWFWILVADAASVAACVFGVK
jgi:hypothetical protein